MERRPWKNGESLILPLGFKFVPTDEELIAYYLAEKMRDPTLKIDIITELNIYQFDPEQLIEKYRHTSEKEQEWYFFTPRDRKYPKGNRPKRSTTNGYWKATGADKDIKDGNGENIGVKKCLVFYKGLTQKGTKTNWIMQEYRIKEHQRAINDESDHMKLDDFVLCKIYEKKRGNSNRNNASTVESYESDEVEVDVEGDGFEVKEEEKGQGQGEAENREEEFIYQASEGAKRVDNGISQAYVSAEEVKKDIFAAINQMMISGYNSYLPPLDPFNYTDGELHSSLYSTYTSFYVGNEFEPAPTMHFQDLPPTSTSFNIGNNFVPPRTMPMQNLPPTPTYTSFNMGNNFAPTPTYTSLNMQSLAPQYGMPIQNVDQRSKHMSKRQRNP
ncbi:PREDICTED: NAC domain-containing protein 13-like [Nelumbo nucifera]|uniref:NAC domain-containing protein 13-like n=1 Tax=Nelumbo nucifera TaxID=4432 RepID=A0A1U8Q3Q1_NELNU|nr:PREDICTED: NAC domain-containing protein 13-like [Nelumbo nucifera]